MIFLKRIELQGFKSFATKEAFDFDSRAVGIVGPNGSGKSNVVDAVRWVLGERGAKNLRGEIFENLIFTGTPKRPPASIARVTAVFDNRLGTLPFDYEEVALSRRIDRSGTSQFFINDNEVRLGDVAAMLAKAKLGSRGLTIINQGQADVFVSVSSEERRMLIEEILGLKEYRIKKKSAERRLERSEENIRTLRAKIEELTPHLRFLIRQKKKWEKADEIEKELRALAGDYFSYHYSISKTKINKLNREIKELKKERDAKFENIKNLENKVHNLPTAEKHNKELNAIRREIRTLEDKRSESYKNLARMEARLEVLSESKKNNAENHSAPYLLDLIKSFLEDIKSADDISVVGVKFKHWVEKFSGLFKENNSEIEAPNKNSAEAEEIKSLELEIAKAGGEIDALRLKEEQISGAQSEENIEFRKQVESLEIKKDELREADKIIQETELKKERENFQLRELEQRWHLLDYSTEELNRLLSLGNESEKKETEDWEAVYRRINRLRSELVAVGEIDKALIAEAEETEKRHGDLTRELQDVEQAAFNLKKLIKDLDDRIHKEFKNAFSDINNAFNNYFRIMFGGGKAKLFLENRRLANNRLPETTEDSTGEPSLDDAEEEDADDKEAGVEINLDLPRKKIKSLEMLSGGEKSLVSIAALFALVSVSPPPFLVLDEIDAALDEVNSKRFAELIKKFSKDTQFLIITHNRVTMEALDALYGVTMGDDGVSKILSLKLEEAEELAAEDIH